MKKLVLLSALFVSSFLSTQSYAQVSFSLNIGSQPVWGPVGYDHADYYYLPDADMYYDVSRRVYVYPEGRNWRTSATLPSRYRNIDLYHAHKVVINEPNPWQHHDVQVRQYSQFRGKHDQMAIRDSREEKYYQNPGHPMHNQWHGQNGQNNNQHGNSQWHGQNNNGQMHGRDDRDRNGQNNQNGNGQWHGQNGQNNNGQMHGRDDRNRNGQNNQNGNGQWHGQNGQNNNGQMQGHDDRNRNDQNMNNNQNQNNNNNQGDHSGYNRH